MSGSRFSGIAVAAANRKALERQEREDALRSSITAPKQLSHKEEALLAQLRAQLLGGGGGEGEKKSTKKAAKAPSPAAPREDVRRYDDIEDIEADDDEEEGNEDGGDNTNNKRAKIKARSEEHENNDSFLSF